MLGQALLVWLLFWVLGWPDYYQQYSPRGLAIACILLSAAIPLAAFYVLRRGQRRTRMARAVWLSVYYTLPFAVLDAAYCGWYLGRGLAYLGEYWYLSVFYVTPWFAFVPAAWLLDEADERALNPAGSAMTLRVHAFFDDFVRAFQTFNGQAVASRYLTPYVAFGSSSSQQVLASPAEIAAYFQRWLDDYQARGCVSCRWRDLSVVDLDGQTVIGTVTWELLTQPGAVVAAWRETYNLREVGGVLKIFASIDHR